MSGQQHADSDCLDMSSDSTAKSQDPTSYIQLRFQRWSSPWCYGVVLLVGSICHFKFPKVVLAHILGEMGTLCIVLLNVYFRTCVPIFIEIGLYLTDTAGNKLVRFFETRCLLTMQWVCRTEKVTRGATDTAVTARPTASTVLRVCLSSSPI